MIVLCECGCGERAPLAPYTHRRRGYRVGQPMRFVNGHQTRGIAHPNFGKTLKPETRAKLSEQKILEKNPQWKGDAAGYSAIHMWVGKQKVKTGKCSTCPHEGRTQWANISGLYFRDLEDFGEMCVPCHQEFDDPEWWT